MKTWYSFTFADGFVTCCAGMSGDEKHALERKHGKLISKTKIQ